MLQRLIISNYALIDVLDVEFPEHLVIITGDSGAGKSILLGALSLLLGGRWDQSALKDGSRNCVVEAQFDGHIVRRVVNPSGRSRVFIDDEPASLEAVRVLAASQIDIHSQNSQLLLSDDDFRMGVVDSFAGNKALLEQYRSAFDNHSAIVAELQEVSLLRAQKEHDRDYTRYRYEQLRDASLREGELEELEERQKMLANAEQIKESLATAAAAISAGEESALQRMRNSSRLLSRIEGVYPAAADASQRIESCRIELKDVCDALESWQEGIESSAEALQQTESRLARLYELMRRNDVDSVEALIAVRDQYARELESADDLLQREESLGQKAREADEVCSRLCSQLTESREAVLERLSSYLQESIRQLEIPQGTFRVELRPLQHRTRSGQENAVFLFSSSASAKAVDLKHNASGGEISRIMLCIKALLARHKALPTVIFDEIDTGTSGPLADKIGRKIVEISENIQVIAITHLPQVAAKGGAHYLVYKEYEDSGAATRIRRLDGADRVREIARMISGSSVTGEAEAAARVLLNQSDKLF